MINLKKSLQAIVATIGLVTLSAFPAIADTGSESSLTPAQQEIAENNPTIPESTIKSLPSVVLQDPTVTIDPSYKPGTPIEIPQPSTGVKSASVASFTATTGFLAAKGCGTHHFVVAPATGKWSGTSSSGCAVFGHPGLKMTYTWTEGDGKGCLRGLSFSTVKGKTKNSWTSLGCYGHSQSVPWGNVLGTPLVQAKSIGVLRGFNAEWW